MIQDLETSSFGCFGKMSLSSWQLCCLWSLSAQQLQTSSEQVSHQTLSAFLSCSVHLRVVSEFSSSARSLFPCRSSGSPSTPSSGKLTTYSQVGQVRDCPSRPWTTSLSRQGDLQKTWKQGSSFGSLNFS